MEHLCAVNFMNEVIKRSLQAAFSEVDVYDDADAKRCGTMASSSLRHSMNRFHFGVSKYARDSLVSMSAFATHTATVQCLFLGKITCHTLHNNRIIALYSVHKR